MTMYHRLCNGVNDKGILIPDNVDVSKYIKDSNNDYYLSVYKYNSTQKQFFDKNGTIAGITDVVTDKLIFDFDDKFDLNNAKNDTKTTVDRLITLGIPLEYINIYYSGHKGFHIIVETTNNLKPHEMKSIAKNISGDLKSFDSVVYNSNRILRIPNTKHKETNLFKVQIDYTELDNDISEIKNIAKKAYKPLPTKRTTLNSKILTLIKTPKKEVVSNNVLNIEKLDLTKKPKELSPWKYALEQGYFPNGTRSNALMILASTYKSLGYSETKCYHLLKSAIELQAKRFNQEEFDDDELKDNIVNQIYSPTWMGGTYSEDNFPDNLKKYLIEDLNLPRKEQLKYDIFNKSNDLFDIFQNFAENIDKNTIKTGIKSLDKHVQLTTSMLVGLLGSPSSGKSNMAFEIMKNTSLSNEQVAFFSMDMGSPLVFQRLAQKVTGYNSRKIFDLFKNKETEEIKKIKTLISNNFENVDFSFKTALRVSDIKNSLVRRQEQTGKSPRLVVIDYLECINSDISDSTAKTSMIAQELKDLANELETCVLLLLQPPKRAGDPSYPLLSYNDIKGAATIAQACSVVISLWREGFNPRNISEDVYMSFAVLKNRMGQLSQIDCKYDGLTGNITELDDIGKLNLSTLREKKKEEKNENNDNGFF